MAGGGNAIRGSRVGAGPMGEAERGEAAPRQNITYFCSHEHRTLIAFAVEAVVPETWDCPRCGLPASMDSDNPPAGAQDRALQDAPGLREGAPLRRRGPRHPRRGDRRPCASAASPARSSSSSPRGWFGRPAVRELSAREYAERLVRARPRSRPVDDASGMSPSQARCPHGADLVRRRPSRAGPTVARCRWTVRSQDARRWRRVSPGTICAPWCPTASCGACCGGCTSSDRARRHVPACEGTGSRPTAGGCGHRSHCRVAARGRPAPTRLARGGTARAGYFLTTDSRMGAAAWSRAARPPGAAMSPRCTASGRPRRCGRRSTSAGCSGGSTRWAAIDGFLRIGVPHELLAAEIGRFTWIPRRPPAARPRAAGRRARGVDG